MNSAPNRNLPPLITMHPVKYNIENKASLMNPTLLGRTPNLFDIPRLQPKNGTSLFYTSHLKLGERNNVDVNTPLKKQSDLFISTKEFISNLSTVSAEVSQATSQQNIVQTTSGNEKTSSSYLKINNSIKVKKFAPDVKGLLSSFSSIKKPPKDNEIKQCNSQFYSVTTTSSSSFLPSYVSPTKSDFNTQLSNGKSNSSSTPKVPKDLLEASIRKTVPYSLSNVSITSNSSIYKPSALNVCNEINIKQEYLDCSDAKLNRTITSDKTKETGYFKDETVYHISSSTELKATKQNCDSYIFKKPKLISERRYATDEKQEPANFTELYENAKRNLLNIRVESCNIFNSKKEEIIKPTLVETPLKNCYQVVNQLEERRNQFDISEESKNENHVKTEFEKNICLKRKTSNISEWSNKHKENTTSKQIDTGIFFGNGTQECKPLNESNERTQNDGSNNKKKHAELQFYEENESTCNNASYEECYAENSKVLYSNRFFNDYYASLKPAEFDYNIYNGVPIMPFSFKEQIYQNNCLDYFDSRNARFYRAMDYYHFYYKNELNKMKHSMTDANESKIDEEVKKEKSGATDFENNEKNVLEEESLKKIITLPTEFSNCQSKVVMSEKSDLPSKKEPLSYSAEKKKKPLKYRPYSLRQRIKAARAALLLHNQNPPEENSYVLKSYNERTATQKEWFLAQFDLRRILKRKDLREKN
ncbi:uncharacterized protein LOC136080590 [Hydra vulgaris]|uniref:Uncharacterized protein LOC136080590 n=1 Tax=Hydra vulgaris TaxID=6087 RepID=A0ABM4BWA7_HYDVU